MVHDEAGHELIERHMLEQLREVAEYTRVVLINGPRQAGKTTLLQQLHAELGGWLRSLDVDVERASARADPEGYIMSAPRPTFLDEVQCAGDPLILAIKTATDRDRRPRQFFLSGSTRFLTVPTLSESLAGRVAILDLWPLSVAERSGVRPEIIAQLFTEPQVVSGTSPARLVAESDREDQEAVKDPRRRQWLRGLVARAKRRLPGQANRGGRGPDHGNVRDQRADEATCGDRTRG